MPRQRFTAVPANVTIQARAGTVAGSAINRLQRPTAYHDSTPTRVGGSMFLGIEIGGTKLQLGLGHGDGAIAALWRGTVNPADGGDGIRKQIVAAMPELFARAGIERGSLRGVGIGFGG